MAEPVAPDSVQLQRLEFEACDALAQANSRLMRTAIVDDDYPEMRHHYESAVRAFLRACAANGRTMT